MIVRGAVRALTIPVGAGIEIEKKPLVSTSGSLPTPITAEA